MSSRDIGDVKSKQKAIYNYIFTLKNQVSANRYDFVKDMTTVGSLYEYTHQRCRHQNKILSKF